ncbi:MAG: ATP-binding protein [Mycobacterium sp.]
MTAVLACSACGIEPLENARFCHGCGSPVAVADTHAEYKQVTVLFADVVHSMDIAAAVGAERLREVMTQLVTRASTVVARYGGTVDKFTGDGIMALFGAPAALEDHALRACLAALGIQEEATRLAAEVDDDAVELRLRVGLNSGEVIAGEIGSGALGYTAVGEQVGMAQRMESVAPTGGVMLSDSTARLVEGAAVLGEPQRVHVKGAYDAVSARQLIRVTAPRQRSDVSESTLVGRGWEVGALAAMLDRSIGGRGSVVGVSGPAGIGKTRLVRETVQLAQSRGVSVVYAFCESHATDIPFRVISRLLRAVTQVSGLDDAVARTRVRARVPDADPQDLLLLDDLLGIADPDVELPKIDPDARRRRLSALINASQLARHEPAIFVIEDVHWIDDVSDSMLAELLTVIPQTPTLVLITYRPEYHGVLQVIPGSQTIALAPLSDAETSSLVAELLGPDPSVGQIGEIIADRAAGNPLFAEEITLELADRGVLGGERGSYACRTNAAEIRVPPTLQATITARIDRLSPAAKHTLSAAAVIGYRFGTDLLISLGIEPCIDELIDTDLIDQVRFTARSEYSFRHPMIRTVAYESQLKADRARLHRRLADAIEAREPQSGDHNAALVAEHFEAAGDLDAAYGWHMRAGRWALNRDIAAARSSWERATKIADALPVDDPDRAAMRIAPRTMLCGFAWRVHVHISPAHFDELRELCLAAGDRGSLAIATAGLVMDHMYQARMREASHLATEAMALIEAVGNPTLTVGLSLTAILAKAELAEWSAALQWSQSVIDLADGNPTKGNFMIGSPLALALTTRAVARYCLGRPGWRDDLKQAIDMARATDPAAYATVVGYVYNPAIPFGVLRPDDAVIAEIEDALRVAERSGDDLAYASARVALGIALVLRHTDAERGRGRQHLAEVRETYVHRGYSLGDLPVIEAYLARERARHGAQNGERDEALRVMRAAVETLFREGQMLSWGLPATHVLVETLLAGGDEGDLVEAEAATARIAAVPTDGVEPARDMWLLRLRAMLAGARGDAEAYEHFGDRYRDLAKAYEFDGHIGWAEALK